MDRKNTLPIYCQNLNKARTVAFKVTSRALASEDCYGSRCKLPTTGQKNPTRARDWSFSAPFQSKTEWYLSDGIYGLVLQEFCVPEASTASKMNYSCLIWGGFTHWHRQLTHGTINCCWKSVTMRMDGAASTPLQNPWAPWNRCYHCSTATSGEDANVKRPLATFFFARQECGWEYTMALRYHKGKKLQE